MKSWVVCVLKRVNQLPVPAMRDAFRSVKSILAMHASQALKLIVCGVFPDHSSAASAPSISACFAVETRRGLCHAAPCFHDESVAPDAFVAKDKNTKSWVSASLTDYL
ncbi:hypothetical protein [Caballeronia sordidicola]|uniref:hypothetical protein n=1 Tax=Caballeronia sordidicola TaxID=196367 RepID=UPI000B062B5F|nr:hypothetical protein [Caballeronia sordidicola]